jgi:hypothetical protein
MVASFAASIIPSSSVTLSVRRLLISSRWFETVIADMVQQNSKSLEVWHLVLLVGR